MLLIAAAWLAPGLYAQTSSPAASQDFHGLKVVELHPAPTLSPFPLDVDTGRVQTLEYRTPEQMTPEDRALAAASQAEIGRRAGIQGFHAGAVRGVKAEEEIAGQGGWGYEQAVCPVFPNHLVLEYSRATGAGDVSLFSVLVPRGVPARSTGPGAHIRLIPVERRGYSLWTPAASNALTIHDFNQLVVEENHGLPADWLTLGLCYAALTGGHVRAALEPQSRADQHFPLYRPAMLEVSRKGGALVSFGDEAHVPAPGKPIRDWELSFAQDGRLLKVKHSRSDGLTETPIQGAVFGVRGTPVQGAEVVGPAKSIQ